MSDQTEIQVAETDVQMLLAQGEVDFDAMIEWALESNQPELAEVLAVNRDRMRQIVSANAVLDAALETALYDIESLMSSIRNAVTHDPRLEPIVDALREELHDAGENYGRESFADQLMDEIEHAHVNRKDLYLDADTLRILNELIQDVRNG